MTSRLTMEIQGVPFDNIEPLREYLMQAGLETGGTGSKVRPVVSCKGTTCQYGLIDTFALSEEIHERFFHGYSSVKLPHKFKIAVGGCPNNCVKPDLNDLGIIGQRVPQIDLDARYARSRITVPSAWRRWRTAGSRSMRLHATTADAVSADARSMRLRITRTDTVYTSADAGARKWLREDIWIKYLRTKKKFSLL